MVTMEAIISDESSLEMVSRAIKTRLKSEFGIDHATVDVMRESTVGVSSREAQEKRRDDNDYGHSLNPDG